MKTEDILIKRQIEIAKKTLKMPDAILRIMGGMTKEEATEILKNKHMYKIITPAGSFIVDTLTNARRYKELYGYPYKQIK